jgi:hypothetical protein
MDFVPRSKSGKYRASLALRQSETPGRTGQRPYLSDEEVCFLIQTILDWPDIRTQPTVQDIPLLVSFSYHLVSVILFFFILFFFQGLLHKMEAKN